MRTSRRTPTSRSRGAEPERRPIPDLARGRGFPDLFVGRIRLTLPRENLIARLTLQYPGSVFRLVDRIPMGDGKTFLTRFEVDGVDPGIVERAIYTHEDVTEVWLAAGGPDGRSWVLRVHGPPYIPSLQKFNVLRWLPAIFRDGKCDWTVLSPRAEWEPFLADLRRRLPGVEVLSVGVQSLRGVEGPLTPRQAEAYRMAILEGYYEFPRRISLSDLASKMHRSKSGLHEVLARAERKMLRMDFVTGPAPLAPVTPGRAPSSVRRRPPIPRGG